MPSLLEFFNHDFKGSGLEKTIVFSRETIENRAAKNLGEIIEIRQRLIQDPDSLVRLFTFYVPASSTTLLVCKSLIFEIEKLKWEAEDAEFNEQFQEAPLRSKYDSLYSKRIFIYSELPLSSGEFAELDKLCRSMDFVLTFRSSDYVRSKTACTRPLAFISHDPKDKDSIVKIIAQGLQSRSCYAEYEEYSLLPGDKLNESIEKGIKESMRCILVISSDFLSNQAWAKKEFNSVFTRERIYNERMVLPVWSDVTKEQVYEYSPSVAEAFALIWPSATGKKAEDHKQEMEVLISRLHIQIASMDGLHRFH